MSNTEINQVAKSGIEIDQANCYCEDDDINHPDYKDKTDYHSYTREECEYHNIDYDELHADDLEECDKCGREDVLECHSSKCIDHDEELKDMCVYCDSTESVHDLHLSAFDKEGVVKSCSRCRRELSMIYVIEQHLLGTV